MVLSSFFADISGQRNSKTTQRGFFRRLQDWQEYRRLAQMDDHLLRDIGLTRDQVRAASQLWDAPSTWRK